jgi:hypothetical protein
MDSEDIKKALETAYLLGGDKEFRAIFKRCAGVLDAEELENMLMDSDLPVKPIGMYRIWNGINLQFPQTDFNFISTSTVRV